MSAATAGSKTTNGYKYSFDGDSLSQDLHMKMCKKIAQLTKVIYVLNTRNDEHENELEEMANQYKIDLRQNVSQLTEKFEALESRIKTQTGDNNKILDQQDIIRSYEVLLDQTKTEFLNYKEDVKRYNKVTDASHMEQLGQLNDKVSSLGESYNELYNDFEKLQQKMDNEKTKSIKEIETRYENDIYHLKEEFAKKEKHLRDLVSGGREEIELELEKTQQKVKEATFLREKTISQYEDQIKELKRSFEVHLAEALEESKKLLEFELEEANAKLLEFQNRSADKEVTMHSLIEKHLKELREKDILIEEAEKQTELVIKDNGAKLIIISNYTKEIANLKIVISKLEDDLKVNKVEIDKFRKESENLNGDGQLKSKQIKDLKSSVESLQQKLSTRDHELKEARRAIDIMNEESKDMVHCSKSVNVDYEIQIQTLRRGLEELTNERSAEKLALERQHLNQEIEQSELLTRMKNEHCGELDKLTKKLEKEWSVKEKSYKEEIIKLREEILIKLEEERNKASKMIEKLKLDNEQTKNDSLSKLKSKEKQISTNEAVIAEKDKEIKTQSSQIKAIKEKLSQFKKENVALTSSVANKDQVIETLKSDTKKLTDDLEEQILENDRIQKSLKVKLQEDMSEKYAQLSAELDKKWADTLRRESGRLRNDLLDNFAKEKEKIIENAEKLKLEELSSLTKEFEDVKLILLDENALYKNTIRKLESQIVQEKENMNKFNSEKIEDLEKRLVAAESSHLAELSRINDSHRQQLENITKESERTRSQYMSEMEILLETTDRDWKQKYDNIIKSLTVENEKAMKRKMDEMASAHNREVSDHIREAQLQMSESQESAVNEYKSRIKDMTLRVQSLENQAKSQIDSHRLEMDKMKALKTTSDSNYIKLELDFQEILKENNFLKKEMEEFNVDYHRNQKEFAEKIRQKESELESHYEQILHNNKIAYEEDCKQTLQDFTKAQNLFKDKIKELNVKLMELEERYQNRPSRDEDVDVIDTLKAQLRTSEKEIERMNEEKKFYKLELINRETNFNKIFSGSPNVGKVDPMNTAIKTKKSSNEKMKNFQKLTPLPGSPFHDDPINPARPLPPSRKSIDAS